MKKFIFGTSFLAIIACLLWSSAFTGVKIGLEYSSPLRFAGVRFFWAGIILLPFASRSGNYIQIVKNNAGKISVISLLQIIVQYILFYKGLSLVQGAVSAILIGAGPLFVSIMAHFFVPGDRLDLKKGLIILLGISGMVLVSLGRNSGNSGDNMAWMGIIYLLGVSISSGVVNIFIKKKTSKLPPLILSSSTMILGGAVIYIISIPFEGIDFSLKTMEYYIALSWLTFLSAGAFSIWFYLLKRPEVKVSYLNFWKFLIPVSGALLAWIILPEESPNTSSVLGVIITGVALILLNLSRKKAS